MSFTGDLYRVRSLPGKPPLPGKNYYHSDECQSTFEVDGKYQLEKVLGYGSYGVVCSAINTQTNERVALKKNSDVFDTLTIATRALREIRLLKKIDHPNFPKLKDVLLEGFPNSFEDVYFVQEYMSNDLRNILRDFHISEPECKYLMFQLLRGLEYLHAANVLHRDLKPGNILVNNSGSLKICDFGLARTASELGMTSEVVALGYRAPELLVQVFDTPRDAPERQDIRGHYDAAIDIWSAGCIFAQLLAEGSPQVIFRGLSEPALLRSISQIIPKPEDDDLDFIHKMEARQFVRENLGAPKTSLRQMFPTESEEAIDLLEKMLVFHPRDRITARDALRHPYFSSERAQAPPQTLPDHQIDEGAMPTTPEEARQLLYQEMLHYHPQ